MDKNVLDVNISFAKFKDDEKYKQAKTKEITCAICALLNSWGGDLNVCFEIFSRNEIHSLVRTVEQKFTDIIGCLATSKKVFLRCTTPAKVTFGVEGMAHLCTVNYNLFLASGTQVKCIEPSEPFSLFQRIVTGYRGTNRQPATKLGSHHKMFVKGEVFVGDLEQPRCVQCKAINVKNGSSVGNQMTSKASKFRMNISALANDCGGHIYHGINSGMVNGIEVHDKHEIINKVGNALTKMIWPHFVAKPLKGKHWDIYFESVKDNEGHEAPSVFVIVISITGCPGGVFTDEPESYHVVEGKVEKMTFKVWKQEFVRRNLRDNIVYDVDAHVKSIKFPELNNSFPSVATHSNTNCSKATDEPCDSKKTPLVLERQVMTYHGITEKLIHLESNGDRCCFVRHVQGQYPQADARLVTLAHEVSLACIAGLFHKAKTLLEDFNSKLSCSTNVLFFQIIELGLVSTLERSMGNFKKSFNFATEALQMAKNVSAALCTAWLNVKAAIISTVLLVNEERPEFRKKMKKDVETYHDIALTYASMVNGFPMAVSGLQQMVHINNALLQLGCSPTGKMVDKAHITVDDVEKAKNSLLMFSKCVLEGKSQSRLLEAQHNLGLSALSLRLAHLNEEQHVKEQLQIALRYSEKALKLANENNFEEIRRYSQTYLTVLTEGLLRTCKIRKRREDDV